MQARSILGTFSSPRKATPKSVADAARSGDRRQLLVALRNRIATAIDDPRAAGPALAALIKHERELMSEIQGLDLAAKAAKSGSAQPKSVIADTPNEAWNEGAI